MKPARNEDDEPLLCRVLMVLCACTIAAALWFALAGCAAIGHGDPIVVRAEDALTNSIPIYDAAMKYHFAESRNETPEEYRVLERVRVGFPEAWTRTFDAVRLYRQTRDTGPLTRELDGLDALLDAARPFLKGR